jgi:alkanesulfonate monooxygenase SsuD/methylene tetrahydromethanopterin reductase-like flavin-dependent oxidoreductase (luciferase family)
MVYTNDYDIAAANAFYADMQQRVKAYGRPTGSLKILPGIQPFVGATRQEAQDKLNALQALIDPMTGLASLYGLLGDLSMYDIDRPIPDDAALDLKTSNAQKTLDLARRENLTIRQLYQRTAGKAGIRQIVGTASDIADDLEHWLASGACDGFNVCPAEMPLGLDDFATLVVPELQRRGLFKTDYAGSTLRENLGLEKPRSRYAQVNVPMAAVTQVRAGSA